MAHDLLTGKQGRVHIDSGVAANTGEWTIVPETDIHEKRTSATATGPVRVPGVEKWSGSYAGHGGLPAVLPGDAFVFHGIASGTDVADLAKTATGAARCHEAVITVNYETGEPIGHMVSFQSNGALTYPATATKAYDTAEDASAFVIPNGSTMPVKSDDLVDVIDWSTPGIFPDVRTVTITLSAANPERITSSTAGVAKHDAGNFDVKVSMNVFEADPTEFMAIGDTLAYQFYVTASTFWDIRFLTVESMSDFTVDPASPDLIGVTYELGYSAVATVIAADTVGNVIKPGGGNWFTGQVDA